MAIPPQPRKPPEIPVHRDPLATAFDREGREPGVGGAWAGRAGLEAEAADDVPGGAGLARSSRHAVGR